jgi:hypothetical protein
MQKIPTVFLRDERGRAIDQPNPECLWVLAGEGTASRKIDGTCCLVRDGRLYKRMDWDIKKGDAPSVWIHWSGDVAQRSGHGWFPVGEGPEDWMHREGWAVGRDSAGMPFADGATYEMVGPKIGKNPEGVAGCVLVRHGAEPLSDVPRTFDGLREYLTTLEAEGVVWRTEDGRMAKIKRRDFGIPWPAKAKHVLRGNYGS